MDSHKFWEIEANPSAVLQQSRSWPGGYASTPPGAGPRRGRGAARGPTPAATDAAIKPETTSEALQCDYTWNLVA